MRSLGLSSMVLSASVGFVVLGLGAQGSVCFGLGGLGVQGLSGFVALGPLGFHFCVRVSGFMSFWVGLVRIVAIRLDGFAFPEKTIDSSNPIGFDSFRS